MGEKIGLMGPMGPMGTKRNGKYGKYGNYADGFSEVEAPRAVELARHLSSALKCVKQK